MASFHFIVISLALLVSLTNATWWGRGRTTLPAGAQLGDTCTPRGSPQRCGDRTLLDSASRELNATDGYEGYIIVLIYCAIELQCVHESYILDGKY